MNLKETLARPMVSKIDFSDVPLKSVVHQLGIEYKVMHTTKASPETDALSFYMLNHAFSIVRQRKSSLEGIGLYTPIVDSYFIDATPLIKRLYYYCLIITARESRHVHKNSKYGVWKTKHPKALVDWVDSVDGGGSDGTASKFRSSPPAVSIGQYALGISELFHTCSWGNGYGGHKWGDITDCIKEYVFGNYTAEMFIDTAYTLCHNNGPIFNKGMLYNMYSGDFVRILDVQRSGQIPQFIGSQISKKDMYFASGHISEALKTSYELLYSLIGDEFGGYVDWAKVKMDSVGHASSYDGLLSKQVAKYGKSAVHTEEEKKEEIAEKEESLFQQKVDKGEFYKLGNDYFVTVDRAVLNDPKKELA